jgi:type I restriction enzyme S subunit
MKPYSKYKASGVEWIGDIPEHWEVKPLKFNSKIKTGYTPLTSESENFSNDGMVWVKPDNLKMFELIIDSKEKISKIGIKEQNIIKKDSILLCCIGSIGKFGIAGVDLLTNQQINSISFHKNLSNDYGKYLIYSSEAELNRWANGNVVRILNTNTLGNIKFTLPTLPEQTQIANFLDRKTAELDTLIANKKSLIELLKEERTAIINHAITKGITPNVKYKDSGIEWIGEIPEHWEVSKLKYFTEIISKGTTPSTVGKDLILDGEIKFIKAENIVDNTLVSKPIFYIDNETNEILKRSKLQENDILIVIAGATIGKVAIIDNLFLPANTNQAVCFIRLKNHLISKYLWYWLQCSYIKEIISLVATQSAQPNLSMESIGNFLFFNLEIKEIEILINFIETKTTEIDTIISQTEKEIELLKEYKTALISEVVLGKVDVREVELV